MFLRPPVRTAARNVLRQVSRSRAALTAVMFGVVAMVLATGFIDWNLRFGRDSMIKSQVGHLQLVKPGFLEFGRADPHAYLLPPQSARERRALEELPGFLVAAPRLLISGLASSGETTLSFIGEGVDPAAESVLSSALRFPEGRNLMPDEPTTAIIGRGLAYNLGVTIGSTLVLIANTADGGISAVETTVVGTFESIFKAYDDVALRIPLALAQQLMRSDSEHVRLVLLRDTEDTTRAVDQLRANLQAGQVQIVPWPELADFYNKSVTLLTKQVNVLRLIIAIIIVLAISNTMTMVVMERVGEIGTMMALGTRRSGILAMFLVEGSILGVLGAGGGLALGTALALVISMVGIPMPPGPGMGWGYEAGIRLSPENLGDAALIAMTTTVLASIYPAWRASQLEIVDALRTQH